MWATWWQLLHSVVTAWKHLENMQSNRCGYVSIKFYFRALKFGFHIIFYMLHNLLLNLFQPFKNAKNILSSWTAQKQIIGQVWPMSWTLPILLYTTVNAWYCQILILASLMCAKWWLTVVLVCIILMPK